MADARLRGRRTPLVLSVSRKSPKPQTHWALASAGAFFASRFIVGFVAMPSGRATETLPVETLRLLAQPCPFACARHRAPCYPVGYRDRGRSSHRSGSVAAFTGNVKCGEV